MKIIWLFLPGKIAVANTDTLKDVGPTWGISKSWQKLKTDNVVSIEFNEATELIERGMPSCCNFYVPASMLPELKRNSKVNSIPVGLVGPTASATLFNIAASIADIVLILGMPTRMNANERTAITNTIKLNPTVQWVQLDSSSPQFGFLQDTTENVLKMLSG